MSLAFIRSVPCQVPLLRDVRHDLEHWLVLSDVSEQARADVVLAAHEAAANAIEHANCGELHIKGWLIDDEVHVEVRSDGSWKEPSDEETDRGRGLTLMHALMSTVLIDANDEQTTVRMRRPVGPAVSP